MTRVWSLRFEENNIHPLYAVWTVRGQATSRLQWQWQWQWQWQSVAMAMVRRRGSLECQRQLRRRTQDRRIAWVGRLAVAPLDIRHWHCHRHRHWAQDQDPLHFTQSAHKTLHRAMPLLSSYSLFFCCSGSFISVITLLLLRLSLV